MSGILFLRRVLEWLSSPYQILLHILTRFFYYRHRLNKHIWDNLSSAVPARHTQLHKVIVIGDEFAAGLGDSSSLFFPSGLAARIDYELKRNRAVRMPWMAVSLASEGATAKDRAETLVKQRIRDGPKRHICDAEIALVSLGRLDCHPSKNPSGKGPSLEETVDNIVTVCESCWEHDMTVILTTVPEFGAVGGRFTPQELNERIRAFVRANAADKEKRILLGFDFHDVRFEPTGTKLSDISCNPEGYDLCMQLMVEPLQTAAVAVEWKWWKELLTSKKHN